MAFGGWNIDVNTSGNAPQKVASAMGKLAETILGAQYDFVAYLGSQVAKGTNFAVLAEQVVVSGRDTKNAVVLIFNEKPGDMELSLVGIEHVADAGGALGGTDIDICVDFTEEEKIVWNEAMSGFVGAEIKPFAIIGTQVTNGVNYIFMAESTPVVPNGEKKLVLVTINDKFKKVSIADVLANKAEAALGYSFTWLKN